MKYGVHSVLLNFGGAILLSCTALNLFVIISRLRTSSLGGLNVAKSEYKFVDDDYPALLPIGPLDRVLLQPEDSVHYSIERNISASEWASIYPPGGGFVRLGPEDRPFGISMYHQFHCLDRIRQAIAEVQLHQESNPNQKRTPTPHVGHCLNYIRQMILCRADTRLEPTIPEVPAPGPIVVNAEVPHTCSDWTQVYDYLKRNHESYEARRRETAQTTTTTMGGQEI